MEKNRKTVLLIVNPCAGREKSRAGTYDIVESFSQNDYKFSIHTTKCQGDATRIVKDHLKDKDMVVCCGGDGTLNETINGVMATSRRVPIGYIPAGTTNDLASTIGIPRGIKEATEMIVGGNLNDYDLGLFNNRYFSYIASFGTFSKSSYTTSQKMKNRFGHLAYVVNGATDIVHIHPYKMRLEHDNGVINGEFVFGNISNSTSVGGIFKLDENTIKLNDGYFEVMLIRKIKYSKIPSTFLKVRKQEYDQQQVLTFKTKKLKITSEEMIDWTLDGEYGGKHNNVMMHVLERAIEIFSGDSKLFLEKRKFDDEAYEYRETLDKKQKKEKKTKKEKIKKVEKVYENIKNTVIDKISDTQDELKEEVEEFIEDVKEEFEDIKLHIVGNDE
ncbi:MAG: YegS/Rv2252/BmrU family lipid kinase [Clostridia bacterium]